MASGYYRYPTLFQDTIAFVSEDDLWSVSIAGGVPRRLTSSLGEISKPLFSPDGKFLVFTSRDEGKPEIYAMPAEGGATRRLTYLGGTLTFPVGWNPKGQLIIASNASHWYLRYTHLYSIEIGGGMPMMMNIGLARSISFGSQGGVVIGRNTDEPARWKRYNGGTVGQIWIDEQGTGDFRQLDHLQGNLTCPMWLSNGGEPGRIYFISDYEGIGNLYSIHPSGADLRRHTEHEDYYIRNASSDGKMIVYHAGADIFVYNPHTDRSQKIPIQYHSPRTQRNRKFVNPSSYLQDYSLHPNGQFIAASVRGKLFSFANWEGAVIQHGKSDDPIDLDHPVTSIRYRAPQWLKDGKRIIAVTDEGGEERFVIFPAQGQGEMTLLPEFDSGRIDQIQVNPAKELIAFSNHRYELMCLNLSDFQFQLIDRGQTGPINGFSWSPDGEWLVYSASISLQREAIKLYKTESGEIHTLTDPVLRDIMPSFDPNGKYIYFLSYREYEPVYDTLQFDLGFPMGMKPYLITLQADLSSPFIPRPELDEKGDEDKQAGKEPGVASEGSDGQDKEISHSEDDSKPQVTKIKLDLQGIQERVIAFPVSQGVFGQISGLLDDKVIYSKFPVQFALAENPSSGEPPARGTLLVYNFKEQKEDSFASGITDFMVSQDRKWLAYQSGNQLRVVKSGEKPENGHDNPGRKSGWIDLTRLKISIVPGAEWRQMFREAWRLQRDQFWTPDMSQVDWVAIHDRYLPLVDRVSSRSEFSDLMWEMQGELGTSHAYEFGGDYRVEPAYHPGFLGADFAYDPNVQAWKVTQIFKGDVWDPASDSPLHQPGNNIQVGDYLLEINGQKLSEFQPPAAKLVNLAGNEVTLTVLPAQFADQNENKEKIRLVTVKTLTNETELRYREWVEHNRQYVHDSSAGRIGYLHIPDMGGKGYAEFHRGYLAEIDRDALLVDLRYNRGGHVSALLLEKLARRRIGYDLSRWGKFPYPYPPDSVLGPIVALTNEYAGSDGDIFSHGFKLMGLGKLIGKRTWGGVIGISPRHFLVDGTITTQPEYSFWFKDVGWGVENYGTDPDIEIDISPQDYAQNRDPQLDRAIQVLLEQLHQNPPVIPDLSVRPSRTLPKLPKKS